VIFFIDRGPRGLNALQISGHYSVALTDCESPATEHLSHQCDL
jgi:hypothetical protein